MRKKDSKDSEHLDQEIRQSVYKPRKKSDILLKGAIEDYFPDVLRFFYADADQVFDMRKGFEWMNKELHEIQPQLSKRGGSREADVLVKVHLLDGSVGVFVLHLEIQKRIEGNFSYRIFQYWYRLSDKYDIPIVSLAVFTGLKGHEQLPLYKTGLLGTELSFKFKAYHIFDHTEEELLAMDSPFALIIIAAQQEALYNRKYEDRLFNSRIKILRALVRSKKLDYKKIKDFIFFMDQLVPLTNKEFKSKFEKEVITLIGGENTMGIMDAVRTLLLEEGEEKGIKKGRRDEAFVIAGKLKLRGIPVVDIEELTGISSAEIEDL